jgi:hypothetical protein
MIVSGRVRREISLYEVSVPLDSNQPTVKKTTAAYPLEKGRFESSNQLPNDTPVNQSDGNFK